jgi:uncharacterized protein
MFDRPVVDSVVFARQAGKLQGTAKVADLERLRSSLADDAGALQYRLEGYVDARAKPHLRLEVSGDLKLVCQRCLEGLDFRLEAVREFELVPEGTPLGDPADEDEDSEQLQADAHLDVLALVEDEAILSLPMVPVHDSGQCEPAAAGDAVKQSRSPFGALSALKRQ